jgi:hypothetical protein
MRPYIPPKNAFDPLELAVMKRALDSAWAEIKAANLIELTKDDALRRAVCLKLFSLVRARPTDSNKLREMLLSSVASDDDV